MVNSILALGFGDKTPSVRNFFGKISLANYLNFDQKDENNELFLIINFGEFRIVKLKFDPKSNTLLIIFREDRIKESDEICPNAIADFGYDDKLVRLEILDASSVIENTKEMLYVLEEAK